MLGKVILALALAPAACFVPPTTPATRSAVVVEETKADLAVLAKELNPVVPFWDPIGLADQDFWSTGEASTIGFLRHAEIKHGRVAMFAFVGYLVQANGLRFPFPIQLDGTGYPASSLSPPEQWDALSYPAKLQIILGIGALEFFGELNVEWASGSDGSVEVTDRKTSVINPHYMSGGVPGKYPSFPTKALPVSLWDPAGFMKKRSAERNAKGLIAEINNGRLAMIGIMGFLSEAKVPGSVPFLAAMAGTKSEIKPYAGDFMAPFASDFGMGFHDIIDPFA